MSDETHSNYSIRSLAVELGLSRTTVSDALRGVPGVNPKTAQRVQAAATKVGYKPNPFASALMSQLRKSRTTRFLGNLAAVYVDEKGLPPGATRFHQAIITGACRRAEELGFHLETFLIGQNGLTPRRLDSILRSRGIEGILLLPSWGEPDYRELDWSHYAGVYADYVIERPSLHVVCSDHYRSMVSVLQRTIALGYRRMGLVLQRQQDDRLQNRWAAAFTAFQQNHPEIGYVPTLVVDEFRREPFIRWFGKHEPDVVLGHWSGVIEWMEQSGALVPLTHGFVSMNNTMQDRPCAGLDLQPRLLGARGVELVIAQLQRNERGSPEFPSTTSLLSRWEDGPTLRQTPPGEKLADVIDARVALRA